MILTEKDIQSNIVIVILNENKNSSLCTKVYINSDYKQVHE